MPSIIGVTHLLECKDFGGFFFHPSASEWSKIFLHFSGISTKIRPALEKFTRSIRLRRVVQTLSSPGITRATHWQFFRFPKALSRVHDSATAALSLSFSALSLFLSGCEIAGLVPLFTALSGFAFVFLSQKNTVLLWRKLLRQTWEAYVVVKFHRSPSDILIHFTHLAFRIPRWHSRWKIISIQIFAISTRMEHRHFERPRGQTSNCGSRWIKCIT